MKILLLYSIIFCNIPIIAHPFYKTMPPEYEPIYQELKYLEKIIINIAKKDYPKIPNEHWQQFSILENAIQKNINENSVDLESIEQSTPKFFLIELEMYAHNYFMYECNRLGINSNKINFHLNKLPENIAGEAAGFSFDIIIDKTKYKYISLLDIVWQSYTQSDKSDLIVLLNQDFKPTITIDVNKLHTVNDLENTIKHELVHVCEGHGTKTSLLTFLIAQYYGENELTRDNYKELLKYYKKAHELQANIVPALLENNYHLTLGNIKPIDYKSGTDIHPNGDVIHFWLQKIEIANVKPPSEKTYFLPNFLKKLYALIAFLKK